MRVIRTAHFRVLEIDLHRMESVTVANLWTDVWFNMKSYKGYVDNQEAMRLLKQEMKGKSVAVQL